MKKIQGSIFLICLTLLCTACGGKSVALSPEEELLNSYNSSCDDLSSEQDYLAVLISQADDLMETTSEKDVADTAVLESLSDSLLEAMDYKNYSTKTFELGDDKIQSEMTEVEEAYDALSKIVNNLEGAISAVEESIQEQVRIEEEKKAALIWPGKTYTYEYKDPNGYIVEKKMKFGSWIKASDRESLNKAWIKAGGEGDAPDISTFSLYNHPFGERSAVMTFATIEYTNKTVGYDFSEQYPYMATLGFVPGETLHIPEDAIFPWQGYLYYRDRRSALNDWDDDNFMCKMKSNHWGPVIIAFAVDNVFTPNFDSNGDPALDEVWFYDASGMIGPSIRFPSIWKVLEPVSISESDYAAYPEKNGPR